MQQSESRAVDSAPYLELEERRRRAEEGKREALRELDLAAEEVSRVRAAKAQLEDRLQLPDFSSSPSLSIEAKESIKKITGIMKKAAVASTQHESHVPE